MSNELVTAMVSVVVALIGLAALATVLSPKATTSAVIGAGSQGLATDLAAATSPVTGASVGGGLGNLSMPSLAGNGI